jgi:HSP20 family protein
MFTNCRTGSLVPLNANRLASMLDQFFQDDAPTQAKTSSFPLAISEDEQSIVVELDAPGIPESNFEVSLHDGVLSIAAERKMPEPAKRYDSRQYGKFQQHIRIEAAVNEENVLATLTDGVLSVTLSKIPEAKPKKIPVNGTKLV